MSLEILSDCMTSVVNWLSFQDRIRFLFCFIAFPGHSVPACFHSKFPPLSKASLLTRARHTKLGESLSLRHSQFRQVSLTLISDKLIPLDIHALTFSFVSSSFGLTHSCYASSGYREISSWFLFKGIPNTKFSVQNMSIKLIPNNHTRTCSRTCACDHLSFGFFNFPTHSFRWRFQSDLEHSGEQYLTEHSPQRLNFFPCASVFEHDAFSHCLNEFEFSFASVTTVSWASLRSVPSTTPVVGSLTLLPVVMLLMAHENENCANGTSFSDRMNDRISWCFFDNISSIDWPSLHSSTFNCIWSLRLSTVATKYALFGSSWRQMKPLSQRQSRHLKTFGSLKSKISRMRKIL